MTSPSSTPIPAAAQPMADLIRELVPRPEKWELTDDGIIRFVVPGTSFWHCPMGLLPSTDCSTPVGAINFDHPEDFDNGAIEAFYMWWDSQRDPVAAMDAVWGKA